MAEYTRALTMTVAFLAGQTFADAQGLTMDVLEKWIGPPLHESFVDILGSPEAADRSQPPA